MSHSDSNKTITTKVSANDGYNEQKISPIARTFIAACKDNLTFNKLSYKSREVEFKLGPNIPPIEHNKET
jgi:hypothetical protein